MARRRTQQNGFLSFLKSFLIVILIIIIAGCIGMMVGYTVLGEGDNPLEVFNPTLWQDIFSFLWS